MTHPLREITLFIRWTDLHKMYPYRENDLFLQDMNDYFHPFREMDIPFSHYVKYLCFTLSG